MIYHKIFRDKFVDTLLDKNLWELEKGEVSEILTGRDFGGNHWYDAYYTVIKVNDKKIAEFDSVEELIEARRRQGLKLAF